MGDETSPGDAASASEGATGGEPDARRCEVRRTYEREAYPRLIEPDGLCPNRELDAVLGLLAAHAHAMERGEGVDAYLSRFLPDSEGLVTGRSSEPDAYDRRIDLVRLRPWLMWIVSLFEDEDEREAAPEVTIEVATVEIDEARERARVEATLYLFWGYGEDTLDSRVVIEAERASGVWRIRGIRQWYVSFSITDESTTYDDAYWRAADERVTRALTTLAAANTGARAQALEEAIIALGSARRYEESVPLVRERLDLSPAPDTSIIGTLELMAYQGLDDALGQRITAMIAAASTVE